MASKSEFRCLCDLIIEQEWVEAHIMIENMLERQYEKGYDAGQADADNGG